MKTILYVMISLLIASMASPALAGNWDAEQGTWASATSGKLTTALTDWTYNLSAGSITNWYIGPSTYMSHGGSKAGGAWIQNANSKYATITQSATLTPNAQYNVAAWLLGYTGSQGSYAKLGVKTGGATTYAWSARDEDTWWTQYALPVTASATGVIDIQIYFFMGTGVTPQPNTQPVALFDDVTITAVPEPGSMIALVSGLVGMIGVGICRRK